ncbi:MAG TPA: glycosyltransferase [Candidatus Erysipelatoclostridium merdavium]|uniref:Glycosyltransferase n=1 Tax=Candidatus Erysipelatoclostridium merdavium TaxID=2838566 RepID=A0A9D2BNP4_9FIRM|nr:glycosyltransferase [Candidatus Erysipelatoclostridium merdavium]
MTNNSKIKISVAMATFNGQDYIKDQLNSIISQDKKVDEIIIVDDCSSDDTVKISKEILKNSKIDYKVIINSENKGVFYTFYQAIKYCTGELVFLSDQDDVWKKNKVKKILQKFKDDSEICLVFSNSLIFEKKIKKNNELMFNLLNFDAKPDRYNENLMNELIERPVVTGMTIALKRELLPNYEKIDFMLHDEWLVWNYLVKGKVDWINEPLVYYRKHSKNVINKKNTFRTYNDKVFKIQNELVLSVNKYEYLIRLCKSNKIKNEKMYNKLYLLLQIYKEKLEFMKEKKIWNLVRNNYKLKRINKKNPFLYKIFIKELLYTLKL